MLTKLIGIPFEDGGRSFGGCDCWGLVKLASKSLYNIDLPDYMISCFDSNRIDKACYKDLKTQWRKVNQPQIGAIAIMGTDQNAPELMNHIGLIIGKNKMLHTLKKQNSHIERLDHPFYKKRIKSFWVYNG